MLRSCFNSLVVLLASSLCLSFIQPTARAAGDQPPKLAVNIDFPGGSGVVEEIDQKQRLIRILPSDHPQRGWRCWWYVHVTGIQPGESITLDVGGGVWATPDQATFSTDRRSWKHTEPGKRVPQRIVFKQQIDANEAWFAWGPPFVPSDAKELLEAAAKRCPQAEVFNLCQSRGGHETPALKIAPAKADSAKFGIWVQARQHAWESGSSWVCRGFLEWITSDEPAAKTLREQAIVVIVPIMDIDNVTRGAGGKNETPQDHNRDWTDQPHWRAVAAAQQAILALDKQGRFDLFIDLHNPAANDREPFYFAAPKETLQPVAQENLQRLVALSKEHMNGQLAYKGRVRESGANYDAAWQAISKNWVTTHCRPHVVAVTLETSWNTPGSTTEGYLEIGRGLAQAVEKYLTQRE